MLLLSKTAVQRCVGFCIMGFESLQPKIIKTRNILKNIPRFWYAGRDFVKTHFVIKAKCKHLQTITAYVFPLKICRTVVRQILLRCATHTITTY